jgi:hypothetical protein
MKYSYILKIRYFKFERTENKYKYKLIKLNKMASTAIKTEEEKKEYFDTPKDLEKKIDKLA